ncbi:low molecular weight protein-tyrosine-phosphatase [Acinetobacter piscicola]|uniref:low molecular weight protein-tyrosine-phosphatase n=1 Tax=Acinetobacter piscicola TaxID=2006115 RepID=UPI0035563F06
MSSKTPYKVLCVCLGNICRSPTAEVVLRHYCDEHQLNIQVDSAGTSNYHPNKAPDERSQKHAKARGYDLSALRARQLQQNDFYEFDLILAMDLENLKNILNLKHEAEQNLQGYQVRAAVALMSEHDPNYLQQALPDPYYGGAEGFERVLDQCESSSQAWVEHFKRQA